MFKTLSNITNQILSGKVTHSSKYARAHVVLCKFFGAYAMCIVQKLYLLSKVNPNWLLHARHGIRRAYEFTCNINWKRTNGFISTTINGLAGYRCMSNRKACSWWMITCNENYFRIVRSRWVFPCDHCCRFSFLRCIWLGNEASKFCCLDIIYKYNNIRKIY